MLSVANKTGDPIFASKQGVVCVLRLTCYVILVFLCFFAGLVSIMRLAGVDLLQHFKFYFSLMGVFLGSESAPNYEESSYTKGT